MLYGMYLSGNAAEAQMARQAVLANNLANSGTTAFKPEVVTFQEHWLQDVEDGEIPVQPEHLQDHSGGVVVAGTATDHRQGVPTPTGGPLDIALAGPGFFQVTDGESDFLTRNGRLSITNRGELVMQDTGLSVRGATGQPIVLPEDAVTIEINEIGEVSGIRSDGSRLQIDRLDLVQPADTRRLQKIGDSLYQSPDPVVPAGAEVQVLQGFLEQSGTNPVAGLLDMIESSRAVEANMNLIQQQDDMLGRLLRTVHRQ